MYALRATESQAHVCALQDQIQQLENRLEILKSQARDLLKVNSMEIELKNWEVFAHELLQSGKRDKTFAECSRNRNEIAFDEVQQYERQFHHFPASCTHCSERKKEGIRGTVIKFPADSHQMQSNYIDTVINEKILNCTSSLSIEEIETATCNRPGQESCSSQNHCDTEVKAPEILPHVHPSHVDENRSASENAFPPANAAEKLRKGPYFEAATDKAEQIYCEDRNYFSGCEFYLNDFVVLQSEIQMLKRNLESDSRKP